MRQLQQDSWLPLFPLNTVLFPGGILPLKVFEARYTDMVRDCMSKEIPFGVVLIKSGTEIGVAANPESIGTLAHITQWDMEELGILLLRAEGGQRFRIRETRVLADQRLEGLIDLLPPDESVTITDQHVQCAKTLKIVVDDVNNKGIAEHGPEYASPFAKELRLEDAGWVANRWCEILPIPLKARQKLLELDDAESRLSVIFQYLQQHKII